MPNGINTISPPIRDFLLNRNLILSDSITNNGLQGLAVGLGLPAEIATLPEEVQPSNDIVVEGGFYRDLNLINNPYGSTTGNELIDINTNNIQNIGNLPAGTPQAEYTNYIGSQLVDSEFNIQANHAREQLLMNQYAPNEGDQYLVSIENNYNYNRRSGGYIDANNRLNVGGPDTQPLDYIGSILNGGGIGATGEPNFDVRASLAGRVLGATGIINDTPLGIIGGQQLLLHLAHKAAFNTQRELLGQVNVNPLSLLTGNDFIVPNYSITVGKDTLTKVADVGLNLLGFELPVSLFDGSSSIFSKENPVASSVRANSQIVNTGKGQVLALFGNLNQNKYRLGLTDDRIKDEGVNPNLYMFDDGRGGTIDLLNSNPDLNFDGVVQADETSINAPISPSNYKLEGMVREAGFESLDGLKIGDSKFTWGDKRINTLVKVDDEGGQQSFYDGAYTSSFAGDKSLLSKTKRLFDTNKMMVMVSGKGAMANSSEIQTAVNVGGTQFMSKGSGVKSQLALEGGTMDPTEIFCRSWTSLIRYEKVQNLQKNSGLGTEFGLRNRNTTELSVLDDNGFVRIGPYKDENGDVDIKRFMFSIENLAWAGDAYPNLPFSERGPGDPLTGSKGRIMWFPPYDINFTDTTNVNWDTHNFIGRGEPLYTYNNSERSGTLQFKIIIDHPSYLNDMRGYADNDLFTSIAAGCADFDLDIIKNLSKDEQDQIDVANANEPQKIADVKQEPPAPFTIYFANDVATLDKPTGYEATGSENAPNAGCGTSYSEGYTSSNGTAYPDRTDYGLNKKYLDPEFVQGLKQHLKEKCPACRINLGGFASTDGFVQNNQKLSDARANNVKQWFLQNVLETDDPIRDKRFAKVKGNGTTGCPKDSAPVDALCKKKARKVDISFVYDAQLNEINKEAEAKKERGRQERELANRIKSRFFNEATYFDKLKQTDKVVYDKIGEKIKFFHPSFHSITPEGFNARLNFLEQCTRQGPTIKPGSPDNMAFGAAPVCILRIGDFYHTKIVMDSLNISFDPIVWDLNPEGVGVQPMIANVDISFKFIGGHSLNAPINKLQNAVSFNFFANTEVYDPRADYIKISSDPTKGAVYVNGIEKLSAITDVSDEKKQGLAGNSKANKDQNDVANKGNSTTTSTVKGPAITGFEMVQSKGWADSELAQSVYFKIKSANIISETGSTTTLLITEDELKKFIKKGVKVRLTSAADNRLIKEELITYEGGVGLKSFMDAITIQYDMGSQSPYGVRLDGIASGNYNLALYYAGNVIQTVPVEIGKSGGYSKFY